jgi:hypothetical protein
MTFSLPAMRVELNGLSGAEKSNLVFFRMNSFFYSMRLQFTAA